MSYTDPQIGTLTISGDPARFVATERVPVSGLSMDFEPVQDLHGYEYPWPAGSKGNILPSTAKYTETKNGVTLNCDGYGRYSLTGTANGGSASFTVPLVEQSPTIGVGNFIHFRNSIANGNVTVTLLNNPATTIYLGCAPVNRIFTIEAGSVFDGVIISSIQFYVANGASSNVSFAISVESTGDTTDFYPYSNICPITGRDSVTVYVSPEPTITDGTKVYPIEFPFQGFNQWDEEWVLGYYATSGEWNNAQTNISSKNPIPVMPNTVYYVHSSANVYIHYFKTAVEAGTSAPSEYISRSAALTNTTFTTPSDCHYIHFNVTATYGTTYKHDISINYPATETGYYPYKGRTVYAGTLTINEDGSGQIVSKMAKTVLDGSVAPIIRNWRPTDTSSSWLYSWDDFPVYVPPSTDMPKLFCDSMRPITYNVMYGGNVANSIAVVNSMNVYSFAVRIAEPNVTTDSAIATYLSNNPIEVVYELAEPVTIQLDPIEITTLIGLNYVWTSDHNLITITFPYNKEVQPMALSYDHCWTYPKAYIDKLEARIAALETAAAAASAEANTAAAPAETRETVAEEITVTEEPETKEPVTKKGGK